MKDSAAKSLSHVEEGEGARSQQINGALRIAIGHRCLEKHQNCAFFLKYIEVRVMDGDGRHRSHRNTMNTEGAFETH